MNKYQKTYAGEQVCCTCGHYCQHYRRGKRGFWPVDCGHCVFPQVKTRRVDQTCRHWKPIEKEPVSPR